MPRQAKPLAHGNLECSVDGGPCLHYRGKTLQLLCEADSRAPWKAVFELDFAFACRTDRLLLTPGKVSPKSPVPMHIKRPPYADSGNFPPQEASNQMHDAEGIEKMRAAGKLGAQVLDFAGTLVKPGVTTDEIDRVSAFGGRGVGKPAAVVRLAASPAVAALLSFKQRLRYNGNYWLWGEHCRVSKVFTMTASVMFLYCCIQSLSPASGYHCASPPLHCCWLHLVKAVHKMIVENNAYPSPLNYGRFPKSVCTSVNEVVCHGIPDDRKLKVGGVIGPSLLDAVAGRLQCATGQAVNSCVLRGLCVVCAIYISTL